MSQAREVLLTANISGCRQLFKSGSETVEGVPLLGWAVESGSLSLVKWILRLKGTQIDAPDNEGRTPLHRLLRSRQPELSDSNELDILKLLLGRGADPTLADKQGRSPLSLAERFSPELLPWLRKSGHPVPPLAKLPLAEPWKTPRRPIHLPVRDVVGWAAVLGICGLTGFVVTQARAWMAEPPVQEIQKVAAVDWRTLFAAAQAAWQCGDVELAANSARAALEICPNPKEKEPIYLLALRAHLKRNDPINASLILKYYRKEGAHTAEMEAKMASLRKERDRQAQSTLGGLMVRAKELLAEGSLNEAEAKLAQAEGWATQTDQPPPDDAALRARLDQVNGERLRSAAEQHETRRKREREAFERRFGRPLDRPDSVAPVVDDTLPGAGYPQAPHYYDSYGRMPGAGAKKSYQERLEEKRAQKIREKQWEEADKLREQALRRQHRNTNGYP